MSKLTEMVAQVGLHAISLLWLSQKHSYSKNLENQCWDKPTACFKETNTGHSYAPDDMHWFSLGTAVRLKKIKIKNTIITISYTCIELVHNPPALFPKCSDVQLIKDILHQWPIQRKAILNSKKVVGKSQLMLGKLLLASLVPRAQTPSARRGSGDIQLIPRASLMLSLSGEKFLSANHYAENTTCSARPATSAQWHSTFFFGA